MTRVKNSMKTMVTALLSNGIAIVINLFAQAFFIRIMGSEYLGLNSLFSNILTMLGIAELGIGSAIIFNLYKPISENDIEKIKSLMRFYKNSYHIIGFIVFIIGIVLIPFIPFLIKKINLPININIIYLLFLSDTVFSYFLSYKRSYIYANQKNYIINIIHIIYLILLNSLQVIILLITKNYYLYLITKIIMRVVENVLITIIANKMYPFLLNNDAKKLDRKTRKDIFKKVKALFLHKVGGFVVFGTDNMIISKYLGLAQVGLYSNYNLIISSVSNIIGQIVSATTASVGNMLVTEIKSKQYDVFKKIRFANFWISCFSSACLLVIMDSFIKIWIGDKYLLEITGLIVLVINFYLNSTRTTYNAFKDAAGIYYEDRFVPIIESILNIVISILLVKKFGLSGIFLGTIFSGMILWLYSYPIFVYKKIFERKYINYYIETFGYFIICVFVVTITFIISRSIVVNSLLLALIINIIICVFVPNLILLIILGRTDEFKYYKQLLPKMIKKK